MSRVLCKVKYKLIDEEGFLSNSRYNSDILVYAKGGDVGDMVSGFIGDYGQLEVGSPEGAIYPEELEKYFELVVEEEEEEPAVKQPHLWDGKENLEVGMVVKDHRGVEVTVEMVEATQVVLRKEDGLLAMSYIKNLERASKTHREETLEKVLTAWGNKGLDFAFDTTDSKAKIGDIFELVYEVMKGDNL